MIVLNWFGKAMGLHPDMFFADNAKESTGCGIISYSSSEVIFNAVMASRSRKLFELVPLTEKNRKQKEAEFLPKLVVYTNQEAHSAIEKVCRNFDFIYLFLGVRNGNGNCSTD